MPLTKQDKIYHNEVVEESIDLSKKRHLADMKHSQLYNVEIDKKNVELPLNRPESLISGERSQSPIR
jgi:hypothetical protein